MSIPALSRIGTNAAALAVLVDGYGFMLASVVTPQGSEALLVADVTSRPGLPLAARWGDWVGWLCVAAVVVHRLARLRGRGTPKLSAAGGAAGSEATGGRGA